MKRTRPFIVELAKLQPREQPHPKQKPKRPTPAQKKLRPKPLDFAALLVREVFKGMR
jgi:hypothetical protein